MMLMEAQKTGVKSAGTVSKEDVKLRLEELKKSAPPSLTFTEAEFDAYSDKLLKIVDGY